jgi:hypothetical protein
MGSSSWESVTRFDKFEGNSNRQLTKKKQKTNIKNQTNSEEENSKYEEKRQKENKYENKKSEIRMEYIRISDFSYFGFRISDFCLLFPYCFTNFTVTPLALPRK